jgi:hypothetical protein
MAESFQEMSQNILLNLEEEVKPFESLSQKKEDSISEKKEPENYRIFGEVYLCNENTFGEFFRIQEFDTFNIEKFQGTEDKLFVFFQDENDDNKVAIIEK